MPDVTASYETTLDFYVFLNNFNMKFKKIMYFHQNVTDCVSNQYTHFHMLKCQMSLQVTECLFILLCFLGIFIHIYCH